CCGGSRACSRRPYPGRIPWISGLPGARAAARIPAGTAAGPSVPGRGAERGDDHHRARFRGPGRRGHRDRVVRRRPRRAGVHHRAHLARHRDHQRRLRTAFVMFERFTDRARRVVALAQREARKLGHDYIGTEHILLGLIDEGAGVATTALTSMGISLDEMRQAVLDSTGRAAEPAPESGHIPFTPEAKKVLELSLREANQLGHNYIGTEHILL